MMNLETEIQTENAFECPLLPVDLQAQINQLVSRRNALLEVEDDADEIGELLVEAERIQSDWRERCEQQFRAEKSALLTPAVVSPSASSTPEAVGSRHQQSQQKISTLAEYQALKTRERKGEVPAGSAFAFWQRNREKIHADNQTDDSVYEEYRTTGGAVIRRLKK
jgi:hypothetical protein